MKGRETPKNQVLTILKGFSTVSEIIDRIGLQNGGIPGWQDQVTIHPSWRSGGQESMIVDT